MAKTALTTLDPLFLAIYLKIMAVDGPVPGIDPWGPLLNSVMQAQLLATLAGSLTNRSHQAALQTVSKEMIAEATRVSH